MSIGDQLLAEFHDLIETPNSVSHLRGLVFQLAVQGNLVEPKSDDDSAADLLSSIEGKRERLIEKGSLKEPKGSLNVDLSKTPFVIPEHWAWIKLTGVMKKMGAGSTPLGGRKGYVDDGIAFLRSQNVWNDGLRMTDVARIPPKTHEKMKGTHVKPGDVLLNITGASIGRSSVVPDDFNEANVSQHVAILRLIDKRLRCFLHICIVSPFFQKTIMDVQVGVSREGLSMTRLREFPFPVPPLAEQERIVAKVDQLMALPACATYSTEEAMNRDSIPFKPSVPIRTIKGDVVPCVTLRTPEAAKALGVSEGTLAKWTKHCGVPHFKIDGTLCYPVEQLFEWAAQRAKNTTCRVDTDKGGE